MYPDFYTGKYSHLYRIPHEQILAEANKITILTDCTSPVIIEDVIDFTAQEEAAFLGFRNAGVHLRKSTDIGWL